MLLVQSHSSSQERLKRLCLEVLIKLILCDGLIIIFIYFLEVFMFQEEKKNVDVSDIFLVFLFRRGNASDDFKS